MTKAWDALPRALRTLRSRARVTARLREIAPLTVWRDRTLADLLGIDATVALQALKIAISAGLSWALAQWLFNSPAPIYAPITASFVAMITIRASLRDAFQRVLGVIVGIVVAIGVGELLGLHAWSIAVIVGLGFLVGKVLRLEPGAAAQIPVTGLLLVGLGQGAGQAETRVLDTLIGAAVAVIVNVLVVPPNRVSSARRAVDQLAELAVDVLSDMAEGVGRPWTRDEAADWLRRSRETRRLTTRAESEAETATDSLRLHPGRRNWTEPLAAMQRALDRLRVIGVQTSVLARTLRDTADEHPTDNHRQPPMPMAQDMITATAAAVDAFAHALLDPREEWTGSGPEAAVRGELAEARARVSAIQLDVRDMLEANLSRGIYLGTLVVETERILDELEAGLDRTTRETGSSSPSAESPSAEPPPGSAPVG